MTGPNSARIAARGDVRAFLAMDVLARAGRMRAEGADVLMMCVGQPSAPAPREAREAAARLVSDGRVSYTDAAGRPDLRKRIARYYVDAYGVDLAPERVFVTTGSSAGFNLAFLALFEPRARVAVASPGYPAYRNILSALSLEVVEIAVDAGSRWTLDRDRLLAEHGRKPLDGVLLASPGNPSGTMTAPHTLSELLSACRDEDIRVVSDEIYHRLTYPDASGIAERTALSFDDEAIVVNSFSKYFCMTGWRIGWMVLPEPLVRPIERLAQNLYICAPEVSQVAALHALDATDELEAVRTGYARNRAHLLERLPAMGFGEVLPIDGAFYAYADAERLIERMGASDSLDFCNRLLDATGVAVTPGLDFDLERGRRFVRISFAGAEADVKAASERMLSWTAA